MGLKLSIAISQSNIGLNWLIYGRSKFGISQTVFRHYASDTSLEYKPGALGAILSLGCTHEFKS